MIKAIRLFAALAAAAAAPAAAQNMPLTSLVERGTALEKKGVLAVFNQDEIKALQAEMEGANKAVVAEYQANKAAGRRQAFCPAKGEKLQLGAQQLLAELRTIPAAQARNMTTTDGMRTLLARRYPCPR